MKSMKLALEMGGTRPAKGSEVDNHLDASATLKKESKPKTKIEFPQNHLRGLI